MTGGIHRGVVRSVLALGQLTRRAGARAVVTGRLDVRVRGFGTVRSANGTDAPRTPGASRERTPGMLCGRTRYRGRRSVSLEVSACARRVLGELNTGTPATGRDEGPGFVRWRLLATRSEHNGEPAGTRHAVKPVVETSELSSRQAIAPRGRPAASNGSSAPTHPPAAASDPGRRDCTTRLSGGALEGTDRAVSVALRSVACETRGSSRAATRRRTSTGTG